MNSSSIPVVMYDSSEAATVQTVTGWVSRTGRFWGNDENMARYDGATHRKCEVDGCESVIDIRCWTKCDACRCAADAERWAALPEAELLSDGSLIYSDAGDRYFNGWDEVLEHADARDIEDLTSLRLQPTEPRFLRSVDDDYWCDELAEDGEVADVSAEVAAALDALNAAIQNAGPSCWHPAKARLVIPADIVAEHSRVRAARLSDADGNEGGLQ